VEQDFVITHLESKKIVTRSMVEVWRARDLMPVLGYTEWENFRSVIDKAITACEKVEMIVADHFRETTAMVKIGSGASRKVEDWWLSRHACNLIAMNCDPKKPTVASVQTYFSIQTLNQEMLERFTDDQRRLIIRSRIKDGNVRLNASAMEAGVEKFGVFHDAGYKGLYKMGKCDVESFNKLPSGEDLLDCIGPTELAANEFRVTQTDDKLRREKIKGEQRAIDTHHNVGAKVRKTIEELGGIMPEHLPAQPSIKKLAAQQARQIKKLKQSAE
jgi:DNA-damage-inducible protein D